MREEYAVQRVRERVVRPPRRDSAQEGRRARGVAKRIHDRGGRVGREIGQGDERGRVRGRAGECTEKLEQHYPGAPRIGTATV